MRKLLIIVVIAVLAGLITFFYKTIIKNGADNSSRIESLLDNDVGSR